MLQVVTVRHSDAYLLTAQNSKQVFKEDDAIIVVILLPHQQISIRDASQWKTIL